MKKIGLKGKEYFDKQVILFYERNYDILRTPDFDERTRLLKNNHGMKYLGRKDNKTCRFCGKKEPDVTFRKIAHALPESIGNHVLATYYECDECNSFFGKKLEDDYNKFFGLYHSFMQTVGKRGIPKCNYKIPCEKRANDCAEYCVRIGMDNNQPILSTCKYVGKEYINFEENGIMVTKPVGNVCPIAIYKTIVKMAMTVLPMEELSLFQDTIKWIKEDEHKNFYSKRKLIVRYRMIPGYNVTKYPHFVLFRRKKDVWNLPYLLFQLTYGCYSFLIEVPRDFSENMNSTFETIPLPEIPFWTTHEGMWDFTSCEETKSLFNSIYLNFEKAIDITSDYDE